MGSAQGPLEILPGWVKGILKKRKNNPLKKKPQGKERKLKREVMEQIGKDGRLVGT